MTETEKYGLQLFEGTDNFDYKVLNENFRKIAEGTAPSGYGYGDYLYLEIKSGENFGDVIDALVAKWSNLTTKQYIIGDANFHTYSILVDICKLSPDYIMIKGRTFDGHDVVRMCIHGVWEDWEWENPPMEYGVIYRTTKRHNGKAVYVVKIACGAMPENNMTSVSTPIPSSASVISAIGSVRTSGGGFAPMPYISTTGTIAAYFSMTASNNIAVRTFTTSWSGYTCDVEVEFIQG